MSFEQRKNANVSQLHRHVDVGAIKCVPPQNQKQYHCCDTKCSEQSSICPNLIKLMMQKEGEKKDRNFKHKSI